ncbi:MAG: succinylglutamate-semialdehyde dehydrogenase [Phycisphaerae bacterium]
MRTTGQLHTAGTWLDGHGRPLVSASPYDGDTVWMGKQATELQVHEACAAACAFFNATWSRTTERDCIAIVERFGRTLEHHAPLLKKKISEEAGKPLWEAATEVAATIAKIEISIKSLRERRRPTLTEDKGLVSRTRYKPHGVLAVLGPFNFPSHLPNGHIVPAVLGGNCVVFKPSELTPGVGEVLVRCWLEAGLPAGAMTLLQGDAAVGKALASEDAVDGVLFTGSSAAGRELARTLADRPDRILALEMGGNNPIVVDEVADVRAAVALVLQSAFLSAGQRCTCARRLIVPEATAATLLPALVSAAGQLRVGKPDASPQPFFGPVISRRAAERVLAAQEALLAGGGVSLLEMRRLDDGCLLSPGIVDVTGVINRQDEEVFGPLLQVVRVPDFDAALIEANATRFGLAAALVSDDLVRWDSFQRVIRAGVVNWNQPTTGASSRLPFGGVGASGNHRPSGYFAIDYCNMPVAGLEREKAAVPNDLPPGLVV